MNKPLADALANYVAQTTAVIADLAESHYWNGAANKQLRLLRATEATLIEAIHEAAKTPPAPAPAPAATA